MEIIFVGVIIGLISSMPIGPINFSIIATALRGEIQHSIAIAISVALVDGCYAFTAVSALSFLPHLKNIPAFVELTGAILVISYGVALPFFSNKTRKAASRFHLSSDYKGVGFGFLTGVLLYVSNPAFFVFWLSIVSALHSLINSTATLITRLFFAAGVTIGTGFWFSILLSIINKKARNFSPSISRRFSLVPSFFLVCFGIYVLINVLRRIW